MFIQSCFIKKNSKELREKLNRIGNKLNHGKAWGKYLCVFQTEDTKEWVYVASPFWDIKNMPNIENSIDCGTNEELFLAISALRDDSDINQYFVTEELQQLVNQGTYIPIGSFELYLGDKRPESFPKAHKASIEELIEHFMDETNYNK